MNEKSYDFPLVGSIELNDLLERVHLCLSYYGGKRKETAEDFDRVSSLPVDETLLRGFLAEHCAALHARYASRLAKWEASLPHEEQTMLTNRAPLTSNLKNLMTGYIVKMTLRDWHFTVGEQEAAAEYATEGAAILAILDDATIPPHRGAARPRIVQPI